MKIVLISTYELGHQPFGLASPAAWLRREGHEVLCLDTSQQALRDFESKLAEADCVALYLPMHTATRIALHALRRVRALNPKARLCAYGLYAPMNAELLQQFGIEKIIGGEFEAELVKWVAAPSSPTLSPRDGDEDGAPALSHPAPSHLTLSPRDGDEDGALAKIPHLPKDGRCGAPAACFVSLEKLQFVTPDRSGLPKLQKYAKLKLPSGEERLAGYTEASRGCKHLCRHCPIVPVYNGAFRVVQRDVVLSDIRQQVAAGAQHITFGDPDFFNGPTHAVEIVRALHREFPELSYDVTIKVEHLLKHADLLPILRETNCAFVVTAVESFDDDVLRKLDKGHTREDFFRVVRLFREVGLNLAPTFLAFTPWTSLEGYRDFLDTIGELELIENIPTIQLAIRLLIPSGSRLLELPDIQQLVGPFDRNALMYPWKHGDPRVDSLQRQAEAVAQRVGKLGLSRRRGFAEMSQMVDHVMGKAPRQFEGLLDRAAIPYLTEPWYC